MKKYILICLFLLLNMSILQAQKIERTQITLLNKEDSSALYIAMKEFIESKKIEQISDFTIIIKSDEQTIEVIFSENIAGLNDSMRGGGGKVFIYTILKKDNSIKEFKSLLQR